MSAKRFLTVSHLRATVSKLICPMCIGTREGHRTGFDSEHSSMRPLKRVGEHGDCPQTQKKARHPAQDRFFVGEKTPPSLLFDDQPAPEGIPGGLGLGEPQHLMHRYDVEENHMCTTERQLRLVPTFKVERRYLTDFQILGFGLPF